MKFDFKVNEAQQDGFKVNFTAESQEELDLAQHIMDVILAKVTKIEVRVGPEE